MPLTFESIYFDNPPVKSRIIDIFIPEKVTRPISVFFIHGGGWRGGSRDTLHKLIHHLNARGHAAASTDYRLSGVHLPAQLSDIREGYAHFLTRLAARGLPPSTVLFGSSAGGHLALLTGLARPGACADTLPADPALARAAAIPPLGIVATCAPTTFEPWHEIFPHMFSSMSDIVGTPHSQRPDLYQTASPMHHVTHLSPPVFLPEAGNEHCFPSAVNARFVEKMRTLGRSATQKIYPHAEHGILYDNTRTCQAHAYADMLQFIDSLAPHA
jgi:acetyl esterase/lipase